MTSYTVSGLKPFTAYQFRIQATNDIGPSRFSSESVEVRTYPAGKEFLYYSQLISVGQFYVAILRLNFIKCHCYIVDHIIMNTILAQVTSHNVNITHV